MISVQRFLVALVLATLTIGVVLATHALAGWFGVLVVGGGMVAGAVCLSGAADQQRAECP